MRRSPGTGTVDQRPSGRWRVRVRDDRGRRLTLGLYPTEAEARAVLDAALAELVTRAAASLGPLTLRGWGREWLDARERDGVRGIRQERLLWDRRVAPSALAGMPVRDLARADVVAWLDALRTERALVPVAGAGRAHAPTGRPLARGTVAHALRLVRGALGAAVERGHARSSAADGIRLPRERADAATRETWTALTAAEIAALEHCPAIPLGPRTLYVVAIYSGLRRGELWALRWADVDTGDRPRIVVRASHDGPTKSGRVRAVPLLPAAAEALRAWRPHCPASPRGLVFPTADGGRRSIHEDGGWAPQRRGAQAATPGHRERAGIVRPVRLHDLRHTCASHLVMGTWGVRLTLAEVGAWLGHSSPTVTQRYAHLAPDHLVARVEGAARDLRGVHTLGPASAGGSRNGAELLASPARVELATNGLGSRGESEGSRGDRSARDPLGTLARRLLRTIADGRPVDRDEAVALACLALAEGVGLEEARRVLGEGPHVVLALARLAGEIVAGETAGRTTRTGP